MPLIDPEVLGAARGVSAAVSGTVAGVGVGLWAFGWRWHRFWVVAGVTLAAGLVGLNAGRAVGTGVLAAGVLAAVAAGMMALELAKVGAFLAGGAGAWLAAQWAVPQAQELWAVFLGGGLLGVVLYRLWLMVLTSLVGTLLAGHAGVLLMTADPAAWAAERAALLNGVVVGVVVLGLLLQAVTAPDRHPPAEVKSGDKPEKKAEPVEEKPAEEKPARRRFGLGRKAA